MFVANGSVEAASALNEYNRRQYEINALNSLGRISPDVQIAIGQVLGAAAAVAVTAAGTHKWLLVAAVVLLIVCVFVLIRRLRRDRARKQKLAPVIDPFQACLEEGSIIRVSDSVIFALRIAWQGDSPGDEEVERVLTQHFDQVADLPMAEFPSLEEREEITRVTAEIACAYQGRLL